MKALFKILISIILIVSFSLPSMAQESQAAKLYRACAQAAVELKAKREEVITLNIENTELKKQIELINQKTTIALQLADNEQKTIVQQEALIVILKDLNISYQKSVDAYRKELEDKNKEIAKLKAGRLKLFLIGAGTGIAVVMGALFLSGRQ